MTNSVPWPPGKEGAGEAGSTPKTPAPSRVEPLDSTVGRVSFWFTEEGDVVQWNLERWAWDGTMETILVRPLSPFDGPVAISDCLVECLDELFARGLQLTLWE